MGEKDNSETCLTILKTNQASLMLRTIWIFHGVKTKKQTITFYAVVCFLRELGQGGNWRPPLRCGSATRS